MSKRRMCNLSPLKLAETPSVPDPVSKIAKPPQLGVALRCRRKMDRVDAELCRGVKVFCRVVNEHAIARYETRRLQNVPIDLRLRLAQADARRNEHAFEDSPKGID